MLPLLPLAVLSLGGIALHQTMKRDNGPGKGVLTPQRQSIFETAVRDVEDPAKLRAIAQVFREQGLPAQADMLEKRAQLRELPEPVKQARRKVFKQAMKSTDPNAVRSMANAFEKQGAMGAADALRKYAVGLPVPVPGGEHPVPVEPEPPPPPPAAEEETTHEEEVAETATEESEAVPPQEAATEAPPAEPSNEQPAQESTES